METADLITFTDEVHKRKLDFLCSGFIIFRQELQNE